MLMASPVAVETFELCGETMTRSSLYIPLSRICFNSDFSQELKVSVVAMSRCYHHGNNLPRRLDLSRTNTTKHEQSAFLRVCSCSLVDILKRILQRPFDLP